VRFLACCPLWGMAALLAAEGTPGIPQIAPEMLQGGALAVLGWTIYYVLSRVGPAHTKALTEQRDAFLEALKAERQEIRELLSALRRPD